MAFILEPYVVYVKTNLDNYIIAINSSAFLNDTTDWIEIDSGYGDKYHHAQNYYFPLPIMTDSGVWRYKLENGSLRECTAAEIAEQETALPEPAPEPAPEPTSTVWDELDAAYQEGVNSI